MADPGSTWGIPPSVRRVLSARILELRGSLEQDARRQLAALGISASAIGAPPAGRTLTAEDVHTREVIGAVIRTAGDAGYRPDDAVAAYISETAFTLLDRLVTFRCLEERGLLLVNGQPETLVRIDPARGVSSFIWWARADSPSAAPRDVARAAYRLACLAVSERVRVLFNPDNEHSVLFPLASTWDRVVAALNDPAVPGATYGEDEVLGWVYQYWNSAAKDAVYAKLGKGGKIEEPEELSAASTLYTERYIVDYLLQNTLGALWVEMHPATTLPSSWPYYVRPPEGNPVVEREAKRVREISLLDPCVGSGHFLVRAFELFVQLYAEEGIEDPAEVPSLILEHNLYGVDIDRRATQIAALALYLKGCAVAGSDFRPRKLNLVGCDLTLPPSPPTELVAQFTDPELQELVRSLWTGLAGVRIFGSLLHPERSVNEAFAKIRARDRDGLWARDDTEWAKRRRHLVTGLRKAFKREAGEPDLGRHLFGAEASRGLDLLQILGRRYDVVVTNPPYAGSGNLGPELRTFVQESFADGRRDLSTAFILRCREYSRDGEYVGLVTQQGWLFLSSFADLRAVLLREDELATLLHLGSGAFEEIGGAFVSVACIVLRPRSRREGSSHQLVSLGLTGGDSAAAKAAGVRRLTGHGGARRYIASQERFRRIAGTPLIYWASDTVLSLLGTPPSVQDLLRVREGLHPSDSDRFVHLFWEHAQSPRWRRYAKGGGYARWCGLDQFVVDWEDSGRRIKETGRAIIPSEELYFQPGLTYSLIGQGVFSVRDLRDAAFDSAGHAVFASTEELRLLASAVLNSHPFTYLIRSLNPSVRFNKGYVERAPYRQPHPVAAAVARACFALKARIAESDPTQPTMTLPQLGDLDSVAAHLHALEGWNERLVFDAYDLDVVDVQTILDETGTPAGWFPLIVGYDTLPDAPTGIAIPSDLAEFLATLEHRTLSPAELSALKARLRRVYEAGPGAKTDDDEPPVPGGDEETGEVLGARIPIPTETFLEELSQKLELHPISVYWLLEELREPDGVVSPLLAKRELEDYVSVTLLRLLGYRWPEQDPYEADHGPILDPTFVDADGIIPLVPCGDEPTAEMRIRDRLERQFGDEGAEAFLRDFRKYVGRELGDWLRRDFFKRHAQQFKSRPIAWHLRSPEGSFEAFVLYHRLSRETLVKLRAEYAGPRIARLKTEAARAKDAGDARLASDLQVQVEDIEAFRRQLEAVERGDELRDRIRCRWKDETAAGRPGPYAPDLDDGVKVNIRPFQDSGLLPAKVIAKW